VRSRFESDARLSDDGAVVILDLLLGMVERLIRPDQQRPEPLRFRFEARDSRLDSFDIAVQGGRARHEPVGADPPVATFRGDAHNFVLAFYGRQPLERAVAAGDVDVRGDRELASAFSRWCQGI
ncbi:MAG: SCP2 sterol-binding domain-containing protein, partial [Dehalococcoidia bacterium]